MKLNTRQQDDKRKGLEIRQHQARVFSRISGIECREKRYTFELVGLIMSVMERKREDEKMKGGSFYFYFFIDTRHDQAAVCLSPRRSAEQVVPCERPS
jgi:hypothetical protein